MGLIEKGNKDVEEMLAQEIENGGDDAPMEKNNQQPDHQHGTQDHWKYQAWRKHPHSLKKEDTCKSFSQLFYGKALDNY